MSAGFQRTVGWVAIALFAVVAALLLAVGWVHDGWAPPDAQCISGPSPDRGGPFYENTEVSGRVSLFPLGVDCTYDVPGDGFGPQTVHNYNAAPTITLVLSTLGLAAGVLLVVRANLIDRVRGL
ncbi:hypothetical protein ACEXQD_08885 [Herbiconiux sp. P15]|uniref:hypothetical protein n=1 Tax=Herbiconiux liukaitaii TaxID=3342799 RepID=UPI0035B8003F